MADDNKKLYIEMQMDELKDALGVEEEDKAREINKARIAELKAIAEKNNREKNADVAKLYENAAEYENELECFEKELEIINTNKLKDIAKVLAQILPDDERNYQEELKAVVLAGWTEFVFTDKTHPAEQLEIIKETDFSDILEKLSVAYPDYDFETNIRNILLKRLDNLIAIKKEHIEEEIEEIYIAGLKPSFVKRIYKEFHGIS
jgi:hypothetical protein